MATKRPSIRLEGLSPAERAAAEAAEAECFAPPDEHTEWHDSEEALFAASAQSLDVASAVARMSDDDVRKVLADLGAAEDGKN